MAQQEKKYFPAQEKSEKIVLLIRRHWFTYTIFWFLAFFMILPVIVIGVYLLFYYQNLTADVLMIFTLISSAYLLSLVALEIYGFIDFYLDVYIVTDKRIVDIKQNGFFRRSISELNLRQIQDVNAQVTGLFPTLLHYGDVYIQTAGERENFVFKSISHPYRTSKKILEMHELYLKNKKEITLKGALSKEDQRRLLEGIKSNKTFVENLADIAKIEGDQ